MSRYVGVKALTLFFTVALGLYLTILVVNLGGYLDQIYEGLINESIGGMIYGGWLKDVPEPERTQIIDQTRQAMRESYGLDEPFFQRSLRWLWQGLTLNLGETSIFYNLIRFSDTVENIILAHLPYTLVLVGVANLLFFIASIFGALLLSRNPGSFLDRLVMSLSAFSSAPAWVFGIVLIVLLAGKSFFFPYPKTINIQDIAFSGAQVQYLLRQMTLPVMAIFLSTFFIGLYSWRSFFLVFSQEDYVEIARAKGLQPGAVERRYIVRPVLPYVITSFAVMMLGLWQGALALEMLFMWPGVGSLFVYALRSLNIGLVLGVVIIFAYLLAITVFILDIVYMLVDPRVRLGGSGLTTRQAKQRIGRAKRAEENGQGLTRSKEEVVASWSDKAVLSNYQEKAPKSLKNKKRVPLTMAYPVLGEILHNPYAISGLLIIIVLFGISIATMILIPYQEAVRLWRAGSGEWTRSAWYQNPEYALPEWVNWFRRDKLPSTIGLDTHTGEVQKSRRMISEKTEEITFAYEFEYNYNQLPQDLVLYLDSKYDQKSPLVTLKWKTPDERELDLGSFSIKSSEAYYLSRDKRLQRKLGGGDILGALFMDPGSDQAQPLKGNYRLEVSAFTFEPDVEVDAEFILYGKVHGLAGTDNQRRDLMLALLWGLPVALAFGLLGAIVTSVIAMIIAATGAWFGGWLDDLIQRITEINMILPSLLIAMLIFTLYSKSIWTILGVLVLLNIFGSAIKNYRSAFLQVKEAPYLQAARAYGASNWRMIWRYMVPVILPVLIPQLVIMVPMFVFYEATLAYLGVIDPYLPTWGKIIYEALTSGSFRANYYWFLEPIFLLFFTSLAFLMLGFSLERILNPRLRTS